MTNEQQNESNGGEAFDLGAELLKLSAQQNPWQLLKDLRDTKELKDRYQFYDQFLLLASQKEPAEQDSLIAQGREIFGYRMDTARADLARVAADGAATVMTQAFVRDDKAGIIAEMVYNPDNSTSPIQYVVYKEGKVEYTDRIKIGNTVYLPVKWKVVEQGVVLLPSGIGEYESTTALLSEVEAYLTAHVQFTNPVYARVMAAYALTTWMYDQFEVAPYYHIIGDFGTGKTRCLKVLGWICYRTMRCGGAATSAVVFRIIEAYKGTFTLDESDFDSRNDVWQDIVKMMNEGYEKDSVVLRAESAEPGAGKFDVKGYSVYGPKVFASRRKFSESALQSRCFTYTTEKEELRPEIPLTFGPKGKAWALSLRNKLLKWRFDHLHHFASIDTDHLRVPGLEPRLQQILQPVLACIEDEATRDILISQIQALGSELGHDRRQGAEGRVLRALAELRQLSQSGVWTAKDVSVRTGEDGAQPVHSRRVGQIMSGFKFRNIIEGKRGAVYAWDDARLSRLLRNYGFAEEGYREPLTE